MTISKLSTRILAGAAVVTAVSLTSPGVASAAPADTEAVLVCDGAIDVNGSSRYEKFLPAKLSGRNSACNMTIGMTGSRVRVLQHALNKCNGAKLAEDGSYGPMTGQVVKWINGSNTHYGPITRSEMTWPTYDSVTGRFVGCSHHG